MFASFELIRSHPTSTDDLERVAGIRREFRARRHILRLRGAEK
jgi:hypothetical protein